MRVVDTHGAVIPLRLELAVGMQVIEGIVVIPQLADIYVYVSACFLVVKTSFG